MYKIYVTKDAAKDFQNLRLLILDKKVRALIEIFKKMIHIKTHLVIKN